MGVRDNQPRAARARRAAASAAVVLASMAGCAPAPTAPPALVPSPLFEPAAATLREVAERPPRVLIVGDSIADQHGSHAMMALREMGIDARLVAFWGWSLFTNEQYDMGEPLAEPGTNTLTHAIVNSAATFDPDVIVLYSNHNYWRATAPRDAAGTPIELGTPAFTEMVHEQLGAVMQRTSGNGAVLYLVEPVPTGPGTTSADNVIWANYLTAHDQLGFGIIPSGDILADANGAFVSQVGDCNGLARDVRPPGDVHLTYYGAGLAGSITARAVAAVTGNPAHSATAPAEPPVALVPGSPGYRVVTCDGASFEFGDPRKGVGGHALRPTRAPNDPVVAATAAGLGQRTLLLTAGGRVLALGAVDSLGDATGLGGGHNAVGIAPTASYGGYWIATNQGQVQAFGDAPTLGDLTGQGHTVVAITTTTDRAGYWLLTSSGRILPFGSATHLGDLEAAPPVFPLVGLVAHPQAEGYWVLDAAGNVYPFGAAAQLGSAANQDFQRLIGVDPDGTPVTEPVPASAHPTTATALLPTPSGDGYWISLANGAVCHFGDAPGIGALHRPQINFLMIFLGHEFYGEGSACSQYTDEPPPVTAATEELAEMTDDPDPSDQIAVLVEGPEAAEPLPSG